MFGISEFAGEPEVTELRCVLKRLYSDFVVVEIPEKGRVLRPRKDEEEESEGEEEAEEDEEGKRPDKLEEQELERMRKVAEGAEEQCVLDLKVPTGREWMFSLMDLGARIKKNTTMATRQISHKF